MECGHSYYRHGVSTWVSGTRTTTLAGRLARMGFGDARQAERLVTSDLALDVSPGERPGTIPGFGGPPKDEAVLEAIAAAADPDLALLGLARIIGADRETDADAAADVAEVRAALRAEPGFRERLIGVLGVSAGLADHLARHPEDCCLLRGADAVRRPGRPNCARRCCTRWARTPSTSTPSLISQSWTGWTRRPCYASRTSVTSCISPRAT